MLYIHHVFVGVLSYDTRTWVKHGLFRNSIYIEISSSIFLNTHFTKGMLHAIRTSGGYEVHRRLRHNIPIN